MIFDVIQPPNWYPAARKISVIDSIDVHIYRLTPKKGVNILEARSSKDKTTAPVKNIKKENLLKCIFFFFQDYLFNLRIFQVINIFHNLQKLFLSNVTNLKTLCF